MNDRLDTIVRDALVAEAQRVTADDLELLPVVNAPATRRPAAWMVAATLLAMASIGVSAALAYRDRPSRVATTGSTTTTSPGSPGGVSAFAEVVGMPEVEAEAGTLTLAPASVSHPWLTHSVELTNRGSVSVFVSQSQRSVMLGDPPSLVVGTQYCGYTGDGAQRPIQAGACLAIGRRAREIEPGGTMRFQLTLWRDLAGLAPLGDGPYIFELPLDFRRGTSFDALDPQHLPADVGHATLRVAYTHELPLVTFRGEEIPYFTLRVPASWADRDEPGRDSRVGGDGFVSVTLANAESLDEATRLQTEHVLHPYGGDPEIRVSRLGQLPARLVFPSADAPKDRGFQVAGTRSVK